MTGAPRRSSDSGAAEARAAAVVADRWGERDPSVLTLVRMLVRAGTLGHAAIDTTVPFEELCRLLEVEIGSGEADALRSALADIGTIKGSAAVTVGPSPAGSAPGDPVRPLVLSIDPTGAPAARMLLQTERTARFERRIVDALERRASGTTAVPADPPGADALALLDHLQGALDALRAGGVKVADEQLEAVRTLLATGSSRRFAILSGGPGTGKTTTVATLLALVVAAGRSTGSVPRIALAAPTGRARSRLIESIRRSGPQVGTIIEHLLPGHGDEVRSEVLAVRAATVHGLLGIGRDGIARRAAGSLAYDVVVVDETSMLDLPLAADLLDAVPDTALVVFVGDPDQLESVGTGSVLASLIRGLTAAEPGCIARLTEDHRTAQAQGADKDEAVRRAGFVQAVRDGDGDEAMRLLRTPPKEGVPAIEWLELGPHEDPTARRAAVVAPLLEGLLAARRLALEADGVDLPTIRAAVDRLDDVRLLCGHRSGAWGVATWNRIVREAVIAAGADGRVGAGGPSGWIVGEPVIMTVNDRRTGLSNGDVGILARSHPQLLAFPRPPTPGTHGAEGADAQAGLLLRPAVTLSDVQSANAVTVHRAQGSEYRVVVVLLPPAESPLANRQLLYTALTRAKERVILVASEASIRASTARSARRMGGLERAVRQLPTSASG